MNLHELREPFKLKEIDWRVMRSGVKNGKPYAQVLAYLTARAVQNRLDRVVGPENWQTKIIPDGDNFLYGIGIKTGGEWVWKWDGSAETKVEAVKGGISGAFKRAAVLWGIGRYLYYLGTSWATFNENGSHSDKIDGTYYKWNPPTLPHWALPKEGGSGGNPPQTQAGAPGQAAKSEPKTNSGEGQEEKGDSEGSQESNPSSSVGDSGDQGSNETYAELWWKRFKAKRGPGLQAELQKAIKDGTYAAMVKEWPDYAAMVKARWFLLQAKGQVTYPFEEALKKFGYVKPTTPPSQDEGSGVTEEDIKAVFQNDPGPPSFKRFVEVREIDRVKMNEFLSEVVKGSKKAYSNVKELVTKIEKDFLYMDVLKNFNEWLQGK
jgi:hypothetical protein